MAIEKQKEIKNYDDKNPNSQRAIDEAEIEGLDVVFPAPFELQLDFDTEEQFDYFHDVFNILEERFGPVLGVEWHGSRSGLPHRHVTVTLLNKVDAKERIFLQVLFGSDRKRELLGYIQVLTGDAHPTLFLEEPKQKALPPAPDIMGLLTEG